MEDFWEVLESCHLSDLGFIGSKYTWCNNRETSQFIKERLDQAVANSEWCEMVGEIDVFILAARNSDDCPVFLTYGVQQVESDSSDALFKFEASWMVNDACLGIVAKAWRG
jgi:hypothetical protein